MKLHCIRLSNFQCFGSEPTELSLEALTFFIGPNGSGKTAAMQALCRLFAFDPALRRIKKSDFHVPHDEGETPDERTLWIEADLLFPELKDDEGEHPTIPLTLDTCAWTNQQVYRVFAFVSTRVWVWMAISMTRFDMCWTLTRMVRP
ncbi:MAG: AAA family ATPase [Candidatus Thiodiazotropha sp.]